jgi:phage FluMu gp28-like protein
MTEQMHCYENAHAERLNGILKQEWTREEEKAFVERVRRIYKDNAEEDLDVIPARSGARYFPPAIPNSKKNGIL